MATDDEGEEFEVERILSDDVVEGRTYYLVKWKGYQDEECTWEPEESFTSKSSIDEWENQKAAGLGLPEEFLVGLQQKMDAFQARQQETQLQSDASETSEVEDVDIDPKPSGEKQNKTLLSTQVSQATGDTPQPSNQHVTVSTTRPSQGNDLHKRKGIATLVKKTNLSAKVAAKAPRPRTSNAAGSMTRPENSLASKNHKVRPLASMAGQRFRNLSHMNNYRKKARTEPAPNVSASQLRSAADIQIGPDTAHVLPSTSAAPAAPGPRSGSELFIPDTNVENLERPPSPAPSDGSIFPPTKEAHARKTTEGPGSMSSTQNQDQIYTAPYIPSAKQPDESLLYKAANGRSWYRGDIVCAFSMGRPIGDARLIHVSYQPYGAKVIALKKGPYLTLDFQPKPLRISDFEASYTNFGSPRLALGLIDPFEDQQNAFNEFAQYLEDHDSAAVLHHPVANISLLLYSCDARSWAGFGRLPARSGSSRARLHVLIVTKLIPRQAVQYPSSTRAEMTHPARSVDAQTPGNSADDPYSLLRHQQTNSLSGQSTVPPSIAHGVSTLAISTTNPSSPTEDTTVTDLSRPDSPSPNPESRSASPIASRPMSPSKPLFVGADGLPRKPSSSRSVNEEPGKLERRVTLTSNSGRSMKLSFSTLTSPPNPGVKLDRGRSYFFISFCYSHPKEARQIQTWLERYTASSNIYVETERHDWTRFCDRAESNISVILLHEDDLNFQKLPALYKILFSSVPACFSLTFGQDATSELSSSTTVTRLFPHGAMYLMTEATIVHHPTHALEVIKYFNENKKPNYRMVMRPNIERWLLRCAADEQDEHRRHTLLDIVVLIRTLGVASTAPLCMEDETPRISTLNNNEGGGSSTKYILSSDNLPGYADAETLTPASNKNGEATTTAPNLTLEQRDDLLQNYYFYYTAARAHKIRRFLVILPSSKYAGIEQEINRKKAQNKLDCGHIMFQDVEKFVERFCHPRDKKKAGRK